MIAIRSEREIDLLRQANAIVVAVHEALREMVRPGVRTRELDAVAEEIIRDSGATPAFKGYHGYPASTCISVEEEVVHGIPGERMLEEGQIVSIDVGACYKGYFGDAAVTWPCGEVDSARRRLLKMTDLALSRAVRAAKTGNFLNDIGRAVEGTCEPAGLGVVRDFVGHGIGTQMHEEPQVANFDTGERGPRLKPGMVLAIEPMINVGTHRVRVLADGWTAVTRDGKPSAHFEHSLVVRDEGGEILSRSLICPWGVRED
ncbi:MAG: type I methionyl aminopeptidase [Candidatus Hydrogenedentes bacterium]|nr:type I methionyl aminopeptidase [Candidatus Hydrogenedentota bacterium]